MHGAVKQCMELELSETQRLLCLHQKLNSAAKCIVVYKLPAAQQWVGPCGENVGVGFHCFACKKDFRTSGEGGRSWHKEQRPGIRAVLLHCKTGKHIRNYAIWCKVCSLIVGFHDLKFVCVLHHYLFVCCVINTFLFRKNMYVNWEQKSVHGIEPNKITYEFRLFAYQS